MVLWNFDFIWENYVTMEKNYGTLEKLWYYSENYGTILKIMELY